MDDFALANTEKKLKNIIPYLYTIKNFDLMWEILHLLLDRLAFIFAERRLAWECLDADLTNHLPL